MLKENRDKRIAHFDKMNIQPLNDNLIEELLSKAQELLGELNERALKRTHSFGIALSRGMDNVMKTLREQIEREVPKNSL